MFKKFTYLAISVAVLLLMSFLGAKAESSTPMGPYNWGTYYGYGNYGYYFTANRNFTITKVQVPNEYGGNQPQSVEIYRLNVTPSYSWQFYYDQVFYGAQSYNYIPLWCVRAWGGGNGPCAINQGTAYPSGTIQNIPIIAGQTYLVCSNIGNYYQSCYYSAGWVTNISGTALQLWPALVYNGYYMYSYWSYYGYMMPNYSYPMGRTVLYYVVPVYIYTVQAAGGTIAPAGTAGPFGEGDNVNLNYTVTPNAGKHIVSVLINGVSQSPVTRPVHTHHFGVITSDQTITAVFGNKITATGLGASLNPTGVSYYATGSNPSYVATPFPGAFISSIVATPTVGVPVNIPIQNSGLGQTIGLGQPGYPFAALSQDWTLVVTCMMNLFTSTEPHGTVIPLGSTDIPYGTLYPVLIQPDAGYRVSQLLVDGFDVLDPSLPGYPRPGLDLSAYPVITYNIDMSFSHTIHASFYAWEITPVVIGYGGTIDPPDPVRVNAHSQYPFVVTPDLDYHIDSIKAYNLQTGDITVWGNIPLHGVMTVTFFNIMNDWRLEALFSIDRFNVIVKNSRILEGGKIFPTGTLSDASDDGLIIVNSGTDLNFTIKSDVGWNIKDVLLDGVSQGNVSSLSLSTIRADHEVEAQFQKISFIITATAGNHGIISLDGWEEPVPANGEYPVFYGDNARFVITPDHGYKLSEVRIDGSVVNLEPEHNFYFVTADHTITASFVPTNRYTITATAGTGGTISPSGAVSVFEGDDQMFTFTPNVGYEISDVLVDGVSAGLQSEYKFTNVTADHTIEVIYNPILTLGLQCTLDATQVVSGQPFSITVTCVDQATQQPINPQAAVNVSVATAGSQGILSGTTTGTIPTNDNKVTISGLIFTNAVGEANVQLVSSATGMPDCMLTANFLAPEPTTQDADIATTAFSTYFSKDGSTALSQATLSWTVGDGTKRLAIISTNPIGTPELPLDGIAYNPNPAFGLGEAIGGAFVIFNDVGNTLTVTNLIESTIYYVRLFGFNGDAALANYNTNTGNGNPLSFPLTNVDETYTTNGFQVTAISPNPAFFDIKFNLNVFTASAYTIEVADLQGRVVASFCNKKFYDGGNYQVTIPVAKLASGSYILKIYNGTDFAYQIFTIVR